MNDKKWYNDIWNIVIIFLIIIISIEGYVLLKNKQFKLINFMNKNSSIHTQKEQNIPIVELYKVTIENINITYDSYGTIVSEHESNIIFNMEGVINYINDNRYVNKGDLLISLDDSAYIARLESLNIQLKIKNQKLERTKKLVKNNILSINDEEQLEMEIAELQSKVTETEKTIENMKIYAVTDGYFFLNNNANKVGAYIQGRQSIGYFFSHEKYIKFYLPHEFTKYFNNGKEELLEILFFPDFDNTGVPIKGNLQLSINNDKLRPLTPQENEYKNSLCECLAKLSDESKLNVQHFINRSGKIHLTFNYKESYIMIPEIAVIQKEAKNFVYIVQDNMAILTEIEILGTNENGMYKIKSNVINNNTDIILKGLNKVYHMSKVQVVS